MSGSAPSPDDLLAELPVLPERVLRIPSSDGVTLATYDWGGDGPPLVMFHATGMHAHSYLPLIARLRARFRCYGLDARAQGASTPPRTGTFEWSGITDDAVAFLDTHNLSSTGDVFAVGHSQGGYAALSAEQRRPGTFANIFAFEPVVFTILDDQPELMRNPDAPNPMADAARRRRAVFPSRADAYANYRAKPPFSLIDDDALRCYVHWGFADQPDGTVELRCSPEHEADLFSSSLTDLYHRLPEITCPVTLGLSERTSPMFSAFIPLQAKQLPHGSVRQFPGRTHFGPLEGIGEMAEVIAEIFGRPITNTHEPNTHEPA